MSLAANDAKDSQMQQLRLKRIRLASAIRGNPRTYLIQRQLNDEGSHGLARRVLEAGRAN